MGKEQHHTGNTSSLLLTCPHASNFKSFLYALSAGHSEAQRSDPGFKAFVVQRYMVLSLAMHSCFRGGGGSISEGIKYTRALYFSTHSSPKGRTMPKQPPHTSPPTFHFTDELQTAKTEVMQRHPLSSPCHETLQHHSGLGTHTAPRGERLPRLPGLGLTTSMRSGRGCLGPSAPSPLRFRSSK